MRIAKKLLMLGGVALVAAASVATAAPEGNQSTPNNFRYDVKSGKRIERPDQVVVEPDGTKKEIYGRGQCTKVRTTMPNGDVSVTEGCTTPK